MKYDVFGVHYYEEFYKFEGMWKILFFCFIPKGFDCKRFKSIKTTNSIIKNILK